MEGLNHKEKTQQKDERPPDSGNGIVEVLEIDVEIEIEEREKPMVLISTES